MTKKQVEWASQHDWFVLNLGDGLILVRDWDEYGAQYFRQFDDIRDLRDWAGY